MQSALIFLLTVLIAVGTNPDESSFRAFAQSRLRGRDRDRRSCSADGICVQGGSFVRYWEPVNSLSKKVVGFGEANDQSRLHFRGTDYILFTVVHGTRSLDGVYLGVLNSWIALPHPKLMEKALPQMNEATRLRMARLRASMSPKRMRNPTHILAALYAASFVVQVLAPEFFLRHFVCTRASLRRGRVWSLAGSFISHQNVFQTLRSMLIIIWFGPNSGRSHDEHIFFGSVVAALSVAILLTIYFLPEHLIIFLGPVSTYATLVAACVQKPATSVGLPIFGTVLYSRPFDLLLICASIDLMLAIREEHIPVLVGSMVGSWLFNRTTM